MARYERAGTSIPHAAAATRAQIEFSLHVDDVLMNVARATIQAGSALEGRTIGEVEKELDLSVALHKGPHGLDVHPAPEVTLGAGDCIVVFASLESLARLREMSGGMVHLRPKIATCAVSPKH